MSQLIDFYTKLLHFWGLEIESSTGRVYDNSTSKKVYILVDDKELVLPTYENLRNPDIGNKTVFHPIPEHMARGESPVISKLNFIINIKLNLATSGIFRAFATYMHSAVKFRKLNPTQTEMLNMHLKLLDKTGLLNIEKVLTNGISKDASRALLNIFLKKGAIINSTRYSRGAIVTFNPLQSINNEEIHGVKLRDKDKDFLKGMYDILYPEAEVKDKYSRGSKDDFIPYLESLSLSAATLAQQINQIIDIFPDITGEFDIEPFDLSFMDDMTNMTDIVNEARRIPSQPGNQADHQMTPQPSPIAQVPNVPPQYPQQQIPPVINPNNTVNFNSVVAANPQQFYTPQPMMTPFGMVGAPQMPMMNQRGQASWMSNYGAAASPFPFIGMQQPVNPMYPQMYPGMQPMMPPQYPQPQYQQPFSNQSVPQNNSRQSNVSGRARF
jgi:hypothetical protein